MAVVTVVKAAKLVQLSQNTLFKHIKAGKLSKMPDGNGIETSELVRVYGVLCLHPDDVYEKDAKGGSKRDIDVSEPITTPDAGTAGYATNLEVIELLKAQVKDLQERADRADSREQQLMELLKSRLLERPNNHSGDSVISRFRKLW